MTLHSMLALLFAAAATLTTSCSEDQAEQPETTEPAQTTPADPTERPIAGMAIEDIPVGDVPLVGVEQIAHRMNLTTLHERGNRGQGLTIAILDNGFMGANVAKGKRLPLDLEIVEAPGNRMQETEHGTKMAEIAYAVATGSSRYIATKPGPKMLLLNTNGFTNLKWAIDEVIKRQVDIVLYAQVWEYGGNVDGKGFINAQVQRALDANVLWINAAGNMGLSTYHGVVDFDDYLQVKLPHLGRYVRIDVPQDNTPVKIVLAWNDFTDSPEHTTRQDLDLILENDKGEVIGASRLLQEGRAPGRDSRYSAHAREILSPVLNKGRYRLKVTAKSNNFDAASRLRLTVDGLGVTLLERSKNQSVLMPADHEEVLAVGASDTAISGQARLPSGDLKPEIKVPSEIIFGDGSRFNGTSAASAIATGAIAAYMSASGERSRDELLRSLYLQPFLNRPNQTQ